MVTEYKAALLTAPQKISIGELPVPELKADEVLVKIHAVNLCPTDLKKYFHLDESSSQKLLEHGPIVLGHEASGVVEAIGSDDVPVKPGTRVAIDPMLPCHECEYCQDGDYSLCKNLKGVGFSAGSIDSAIELLHQDGIGGCFAEYIKVPAENLYRLPDSLSFEAAAVMEPLADVLHSIEAGAPKPGETAVVFGLGAMGLMHIRVMSAMGIDKVIGIDPLAPRREKAIEFGAYATLDPIEQDPVAYLREATGGLGANVIFVCAGGNAQKVCTDQALKSIRKKGRVMLYASALKPADMMIDINHIHYGLVVLTGTVGFYKRHAEKALRLLNEGVVDANSIRFPTFPLERIQEAFDIYNDPDVLKVGINIG